MTIFLAAKSPTIDGQPWEAAIGDANIFGAPFDATESFRTGAAKAPGAIREFSQSLESYSPSIQRDLSDLALIDHGDLSVSGLPVDEALRTIGRVVSTCDRLPIVLGGEHTVTLGAVSGLVERFPDIVLLQIDAHLDLLDEYMGVRVGHATFARRVIEVIGHKALVQLGIRSGTREEFELARLNMFSAPTLALPMGLRNTLRTRPVYLSIDIDVLDPAFAPGTGYPEPGGITFRDLMDFVHSLSDLRLVAADVCEVMPDCDPAGITATAAAKLVREIALLWG